MSERLGTAQWEEQPLVSQKYPFAQGKFWLGRAENGTAIGYGDDRHICLVSGTRGGKGTSIIVNNLCFWPGSAVVVDPKGENATVTTARRGKGSEHCAGMGQAVHVLDPFNVAHVDECYRSCFNPLADLDPQREETIDEAKRIANALVVVKDESSDPFWDESARAMLEGLILHVLTYEYFADDERNLITIRKLISRGEWRIAETLRESGVEKIDPPYLLLWRAMEDNPAFDGVIAAIGARFRALNSKTFDGVLQGVLNHTAFLDSPGMRRMLAKSDFKLSELKTRPEGMTLYLSLPQRYMNTHYHWLRMMVALTTTEMEITPGKPASGHPVLMVLDEFAGLRRMTAIEDAVAQIAGFGVKLFFVLQSLEQLKATYKDKWETFLSNAGLKVFFSIDDHFTREYVSKLAGETEIVREVRSSNESRSQSKSTAEGRSQSQAHSQSATRGTSQSDTKGMSSSQTRGTSQSFNESRTEGVNQSRSFSESFGTNNSAGWSSGSSSSWSMQGGYSFGSNSSASGSSGSSHSTTDGTSEGTSSSVSRGTTDGSSRSDTRGTSDSRTAGASTSETFGSSTTSGTSQTRTEGTSQSAGSGSSETIHRRPLIQPDEVGRFFARIDDRSHPFYPGLALVMITGKNPLAVMRTHYFEDPQFIDCFSPHPDHAFSPAVVRTIGGIRPLIETLEAVMNGQRLRIARWFIEPGKVTMPGQLAATIEHVPPDNRTVHITVPYFGKVYGTCENRLPSGKSGIPDGTLFAVKSYSEKKSDIDPFHELREACRALKKPSVPRLTGNLWTSPQFYLILMTAVIALAAMWEKLGVPPLVILPFFIAWSVAQFRKGGWAQVLMKCVLYTSAFWIVGANLSAQYYDKQSCLNGALLAALLVTLPPLTELLVDILRQPHKTYHTLKRPAGMTAARVPRLLSSLLESPRLYLLLMTAVIGLGVEANSAPALVVAFPLLIAWSVTQFRKSGLEQVLTKCALYVAGFFIVGGVLSSYHYDVETYFSSGLGTALLLTASPLTEWLARLYYKH